MNKTLQNLGSIVLAGFIGLTTPVFAQDYNIGKIETTNLEIQYSATRKQWFSSSCKAKLEIKKHKNKYTFIDGKTSRSFNSVPDAISIEQDGKSLDLTDENEARKHSQLYETKTSTTIDTHILNAKNALNSSDTEITDNKYTNKRIVRINSKNCAYTISDLNNGLGVLFEGEHNGNKIKISLNDYCPFSIYKFKELNELKAYVFNHADDQRQKEINDALSAISK